MRGIQLKTINIFYIIEGSLLMEIENEESFIMQKGDFYVVKKNN